MKRLETPRLILRAFTPDDLADLYEYAKNPNVGPHAGWPAHKSLDHSRAALRDFIKHRESWAIELAGSGKVIGSVGLHTDRLWERAGVKMLGYVLSERYWGNGYATEAARSVIRYAFEVEKLQLLTVYHYSYNAPSRKVVKRCGFIRDGILVDAAVLPDGNITDEVCYSMTRADYRAIKPRMEPLRA
ncbi:MAG: GNAT family N-acetyltransferase [Oscillospiraceae bacterium]|nr:GNAT family N-acetyltransferase [Oscillospiraceae bacterium]